MNIFKKLFYKFCTKKKTTSNGDWGELDHTIIERVPVKRKFKYNADGWDLVVNNYTKCDVLEYDTWECECYEGDGDYDYVISQVASDIYFLWWKVTTIYSMVSIMKVTKEWMAHKDAMTRIYNFTNHGSSQSLPDMPNYSRQCRDLGGYPAYIGQSPCEIGYDYLIFDDHAQNAYHDSPFIYVNFD